MAKVTSASPMLISDIPTFNNVLLLGVKLNGGIVRTEVLVDGSWVDTGDAYNQDGAYLVNVDRRIPMQVVCTGLAVVETP